MGTKVFIDTSAWISYILDGEQKHKEIKVYIEQSFHDGVVLYTSNDVIDETVTRLVYATNPKVVKQFLSLLGKSIASRYIIQVWVDEQTQKEAMSMVVKYADQKLSLTDATSMVLYRRFGMKAIVTLDSDFPHLGFTSVP